MVALISFDPFDRAQGERRFVTLHFLLIISSKFIPLILSLVEGQKNKCLRSWKSSVDTLIALRNMYRNDCRIALDEGEGVCLPPPQLDGLKRSRGVLIHICMCNECATAMNVKRLHAPDSFFWQPYSAPTPLKLRRATKGMFVFNVTMAGAKREIIFITILVKSAICCDIIRII